MRRSVFIPWALFLVMSCGSSISTPSLTSLWLANPQSINFLNLQRMALDLRADSTYRYYYLNAPIPPNDVGDEYAEGGTYSVRGDSLLFTVQIANGNQTTFEYSRKYRLLSDSTDWPLRVSFKRLGTDFEVYFQTQR